MRFADALAALTDYCSRRAGRVLLVGLVLALLSGAAAYLRLGVSGDTDARFASPAPWRQSDIAFNAAFPQFQDLLVAVVEASAPEEAEATAAQLARALAADTGRFRSVWRPDASPWFDTNGLLFLEPKRLQEVLDRTVGAQPFLGQIAADPSARGLFAGLSLLAIGADKGDADLAPSTDALRSLHQSLAQAAAGKAQPLSWERLLGLERARPADRRFVLVQPALNRAASQPRGAAVAALLAAAADLEFVRAGRAHVDVTGQAARAGKEISSAVEGALEGTVASVMLAALCLLLAMRDWRLVVPIVLTLGFGLLLTTGFAALLVGTLNVASLVFPFLFVGIAAGFAIQFSVGFREIRSRNDAPGMALVATAMIAGPRIVTEAAASSAGFLAFVPTAFGGLAELGLIGGVGALIAALCTLTFLPAALAVCGPRGEGAPVGFRAGDAAEAWLLRHRAPVLSACAVLAVVGAAMLPLVRFDGDTPDLGSSNGATGSALNSARSVDALAPSQSAADAMAARLKALPLVADVLTLSSFVPADQQTKLPLIADAANILHETLAPRAPAAPVTAGDIRLAAASALSQIDHAAPKLQADDPLRAIGDDLRLLQTAPDATLMTMNAALTRFLPGQLERLRMALGVPPVDVSAIPAEIARDWTLPDGRVRVRAVAKADASGNAGLDAFVAQVRSVAPDAGGGAVAIVEQAHAVVGAFWAVGGALIAIGAILTLMLRRPLHVALVLAPLLFSALLTLALVVALQLPLNSTDIIALPLLFGVSVSFNIDFVMNWRAGARRFLGTAGARAILLSALLTGAVFGSLTLSGYPRAASLGTLLLLGLGATLAVSLTVTPTLLRSLRARA